jgi:hypothetical protein
MMPINKYNCYVRHLRNMHEVVVWCRTEHEVVFLINKEIRVFRQAMAD